MQRQFHLLQDKPMVASGMQVLGLRGIQGLSNEFYYCKLKGLRVIEKLM